MGGLEPEGEDTGENWRDREDLFDGTEVVNRVLIKFVNGAVLHSLGGVDLDELMGVLLVAVDAGRWTINRGRDGGLVLLVFCLGLGDGGAGTWMGFVAIKGFF